MARVSFHEGDLAQCEVDAVVNAANTQLELGSGVAGAIRVRGGPAIQSECDAHGPVALGEVVLTSGGELPAAWVLHAAAMEIGGGVTEEHLRACTRGCLALAAQQGLRRIAFPAIGTGVGGFSMQRCAEVMIEEVHAFLEADERLDEVRFVLHGEPALRVFEQVDDARKIRLQMEKLGR